MSERYYLLRNNRESGPFALDELLQQCLLPGDLLWVEGRSQNWTAPYELPEVEQALPKGYSYTPTEPVSFEHISDREQALRAEGIRRRALAALYQQQAPLHIGTPRTEMSTGYALTDPEGLEVVRHKPERVRGALPEFLLFCTLSALVVIGWRGGVFAHLIQVRTPATEMAAQRLTNESNHAARALSVLPQPTAPNNAASPAATVDTTLRADSSLTSTNVPLRRIKPRLAPAPVGSNTAETTAVAGTQPIERGSTPTTVSSVSNNPESRREGSMAATPLVTKEKEKEDKPAVSAPEAAPATAKVDEAPREEKRRGFLRGLFKKKKRDEAPAETGN